MTKTIGGNSLPWPLWSSRASLQQHPAWVPCIQPCSPNWAPQRASDTSETQIRTPSPQWPTPPYSVLRSTFSLLCPQPAWTLPFPLGLLSCLLAFVHILCLSLAWLTLSSELLLLHPQAPEPPSLHLLHHIERHSVRHFLYHSHTGSYFIIICFFVSSLVCLSYLLSSWAVLFYPWSRSSVTLSKELGTW